MSARVRRIELTDAEPLFERIDAYREDLLRWLPWVVHIQRVGDVKTFIDQSHVVDAQGPRAHECALIVDDEVVGVVGLNRFDWHQRIGNVGYWIDPRKAGFGHVTAAVREIVPFGFEVLGLERLEIRASTDNLASHRVAEKAGFQREGVLRASERWGDERKDMVLFSRLPSD